ncbi:hypothetical protein I4U23_003529 [Adineta vaga]|nr:hypothetical protein I4U23_003529 [Adineta vaga]
MGCDASSKVQPLSEPIKEKQNILIVVTGTSDNTKTINKCVESLRKVCGQHEVELCQSYDRALAFIRDLGEQINVILVIAGDSQKKLKEEIPSLDGLPFQIRNIFVYRSENEDKEKPNTSQTQYVSGKRHLLSAICDVLKVLEVPTIQKHIDQSIIMTVHQNTFNELFKAIQSIQFSKYEILVKISRMKVVLSPGVFQFICNATFKKVIEYSSEAYGECSLYVNNDDNKLMFKLDILNISLPAGIGLRNVAMCVPPIPLGFINIAHQIDLLDLCETKKLSVTARHFEYTSEDKTVTISLQLHIAQAVQEHK